MNKTKVNSRLDRHEDIGYGFIKNQGLIKFLKYCFDKNIPVVLETQLKMLVIKIKLTI